jgi:hypothetical protein
VELFRKKDSRFYWYDFKVHGKRYRGSTQETNKKRAGRVASLRLSQALGGAGLLHQRAPRLQEFSIQFLRWVESATLAYQHRESRGSDEDYGTPRCESCDAVSASRPRDSPICAQSNQWIVCANGCIGKSMTRSGTQAKRNNAVGS